MEEIRLKKGDFVETPKSGRGWVTTAAFGPNGVEIHVALVSGGSVVFSTQKDIKKVGR